MDQQDHLEQLEEALFQKMEDLGNNLHHLRSLKYAQSRALNNSEAHEREFFEAMERYRSRGPIDLLLKMRGGPISSTFPRRHLSAPKEINGTLTGSASMRPG